MEAIEDAHAAGSPFVRGRMLAQAVPIARSCTRLIRMWSLPNLHAALHSIAGDVGSSSSSRDVAGQFARGQMLSHSLRTARYTRMTGL